MVKVVTDVTKANVITHNGVFHADDIMATVILELALKDIYVYRTYEVPENIDSKNIVIYDVGKGKFDHHGKNIKRRDNGVAYASAGLIWQEYGKKILEELNYPEVMFYIMDKYMLQGIDAVDNGEMQDGDYPVRSVSLSDLISEFNPSWDDEDCSIDEAFLKAVSFAKGIFLRRLKRVNSKLVARHEIEKKINNTNGNIMVLEEYMPWKDGIFNSQNDKSKNIKYVILPSERIGFECHCVPIGSQNSNFRKPFPKNWLGLQNKELQKESGTKTAFFCNENGQFAIARLKCDAIKMAKHSLQTK